MSLLLLSTQYLNYRSAYSQYSVCFIGGNEFRKHKNASTHHPPCPIHPSLLSLVSLHLGFGEMPRHLSVLCPFPFFIFWVPAKVGCSSFICHLPYAFLPASLSLYRLFSALPSLPFHQLCLAISCHHFPSSESSPEASSMKSFLISFSPATTAFLL